MRVSAVVVSHAQPAELAVCAEALTGQVDELVVVGNVPGSVGRLPEDVRVIVNERSRSFAGNANTGVAATSGDAVVVANADTVPGQDSVPRLASFLAARARCGIVGPRLVYPDGTWQPSRRSFPTVTGTAVRRTPLRSILNPRERQHSHYLLDEGRTEPVAAEWMLGAFLLCRRRMLAELGGFDEGYPLYCEDIDLCYRAARAGWERWYVPAAVVEHAYAAEIDERFLTRRTILHARGMARFVRKHPERLLRFLH
jgi:N-acetylglucosaminyl-diphospho-decaprenol L-rhamnosyltransferase